MDLDDWRAETTESLLEELANDGILEITATASAYVGVFRDEDDRRLTVEHAGMHEMLVRLAAKVNS